MMRLRAGALEEYRRHHAAVWPELQEQIAASGIESFSIFEADPILIVSSEVADEDAWRRLWESPIHRRWGELMEPLMEFGPDGLIDSVELREIYRFPTGS